MTNKTLENKLMSFYSYYSSLHTMLNFYANTILNDDSNGISRNEIDCIFENISEKIDGKEEELTEILDEFQETYCKPKTELI